MQSTENRKEEDKTMKAQQLSIPHHEEALKDSKLQFNKLQESAGDLLIEESRVFGDFVAREAILDEEYWVCTNCIAHATHFVHNCLIFCKDRFFFYLA